MMQAHQEKRLDRIVRSVAWLGCEDFTRFGGTPANGRVSLSRRLTLGARLL